MCLDTGTDTDIRKTDEATYSERLINSEVELADSLIKHINRL